MKIQIECTEKELNLINQTLELYARLSMGQIKEILQINTINSIIEDLDMAELKCDHLKQEIFGLSHGAFLSIGNKNVKDDARIAFDLHQTIRHELWKTRNEPNTGMISHYPADTCKMYGVELPNFKITINE